MHSRDMMKQIGAEMSDPMHKMVHEKFLKNQDKLPADFEAQMNRMMDEMLQGFPWDQYIDATMPIYQKHFTKGDLAALTTFYSSPTRQKVLLEIPPLMPDSLQLTIPLFHA